MNRINDPSKGFYNYSYEIAKVALNFALSSAIQIGTSDKRISNVVGGSLLMGFGISLMAKADVPKMLKSHRSKTVDMPQQAILEKIMRLGMASLGLVIVGIGAYSLCAGISEFVQPSFNVNSSFETCEQKLEDAKKVFFKCPEARNLWKDVEKDGKFTLQYAGGMRHGGSTFHEGRKIFINDYTIPGTKALPMNNIIAFELINLKNSKPFMDLNERMCSINMEEFAYQKQLLEFETAKIFNDLNKKCTEKGVWEPSPIYDTDGGKVLSDQLASGHTGAYLLSWIAKCNFEKLEAAMAALVESRNRNGIKLPLNFKAFYDILAKHPSEFFKKRLANLKI